MSSTTSKLYLLGACAFAFALAGCPEKPSGGGSTTAAQPAKPAAPTGAASQPSGSAQPATGAAQPAAQAAPTGQNAGTGHMANCPSAVAGATTKVDDAADSVVVTVTAAGDPAVADIRARAKHLAEVAVKNPTDVKHDKEGDGGGGLGSCPVVLADTTLAVEEVPNGAKITVKPAKAEDLAKVKQAAHDRQAKLAAAPPK